MTLFYAVAPYLMALGYKNSCHREERSDLHLSISVKGRKFPVEGWLHPFKKAETGGVTGKDY